MGTSPYAEPSRSTTRQSKPWIFCAPLHHSPEGLQALAEAALARTAATQFDKMAVPKLKRPTWVAEHMHRFEVPFVLTREESTKNKNAPESYKLFSSAASSLSCVSNIEHRDLSFSNTKVPPGSWTAGTPFASNSLILRFNGSFSSSHKVIGTGKWPASDLLVGIKPTFQYIDVELGLAQQTLRCISRLFGVDQLMLIELFPLSGSPWHSSYLPFDGVIWSSHP